MAARTPRKHLLSRKKGAAGDNGSERGARFYARPALPSSYSKPSPASGVPPVFFVSSVSLPSSMIMVVISTSS